MLSPQSLKSDEEAGSPKQSVQPDLQSKGTSAGCSGWGTFTVSVSRFTEFSRSAASFSADRLGPPQPTMQLGSKGSAGNKPETGDQAPPTAAVNSQSEPGAVFTGPPVAARGY